MPLAYAPARDIRIVALLLEIDQPSPRDVAAVVDWNLGYIRGGAITAQCAPEGVIEGLTGSLVDVVWTGVGSCDRGDCISVPLVVAGDVFES